MKFKSKNLREIAECIIGDKNYFNYKTSWYISEFFKDCGLPFMHDGSTRWAWTSDRLAELLEESCPPTALPPMFVHVLRTLMHKSDATEDDPGRINALIELNKPLSREGYEAFYSTDNNLYIKNLRYYVATAQNYNNQLFNKKEAKLNLASLKITISNLYKTNITNDYLYFDYV